MSFPRFSSELNLPRCLFYRRIQSLFKLFVIGLFLWGYFGGGSARAQVPDLKPQGHVNDYAGVLNPAVRQRLEVLGRELDQKTGSQMAIVIVNSLEEEPIEDYAIALAERWGIGRKERGDTGVLLLLAIQDRRNRIEVGYGLEPILPDGRVGGILRAMRPHLRNGDYDSAVALGAAQIAGFIAREHNVSLGSPMPRTTGRAASRREGSPLRSLIRLAFLLGIMLLVFRPSRRRRGGWYGSGRGMGTGLVMGGLMGAMLGGGMRGDYGGGGGFSSGGFGGFGGGGFGGGGASGSW